MSKIFMNKKGVNMGAKNIFFKSAAFLLMAWLLLIPTTNAQAAVKKLNILNGSSKTSCQIDLDGDGVKENLKLTTKYDAYGCITKAVFYVNNQKALMLNKPNWVFSIGVDYVKMSDSNIFIRCCTTGDNDIAGSDYFYRYDPSRKKLVKETRLLDINESCSSASIKTVTDSEVKIKYYHQLKAIGGITWTASYAIRDGKLKLKSTAYKAKSTATTKYGDSDGYGKLLEKNQYKSIRGDLILRTDTSMNTIAFRVNQDDILTLKKIKYTKDEWYVQFEKDGKKGWLGLSGIGSMDLFYGVRERLAG